jgi:hypothetical protein
MNYCFRSETPYIFANAIKYRQQKNANDVRDISNVESSTTYTTRDLCPPAPAMLKPFAC